MGRRRCIRPYIKIGHLTQPAHYGSDLPKNFNKSVRIVIKVDPHFWSQFVRIRMKDVLGFAGVLSEGLLLFPSLVPFTLLSPSHLPCILTRAGGDYYYI